MEAKMRKMLMIAVAGVLLLAGSAFLVKSAPTSATYAPQSSHSAFDLMSKSKNLPTAPAPDAF
jgi:hypothetical protein